MPRTTAAAAICIFVTLACSSGTPHSNSQPGVAGADPAATGGTAPGEAETGGGLPGVDGEAGRAPTAGGSVDLPGVTNARYIGELTATDGRRMRARVLLRSGDLASIPDCTGLQSWDLKSVIDLRDLEHPDYAPDADCVRVTTKLYQADLPRLLPPSEEAYYDTLVAAEPRLAAVFVHLSAEEALPALIHCVIGRDRASLVTALVLLAVGIPRDQVLDDMTNNQDPGIVIEPGWMDRVFSRIDESGGILPYLHEHGVTEIQIQALRDQALLP
jgi:hypothetical protein